MSEYSEISIHNSLKPIVKTFDVLFRSWTNEKKYLQHIAIFTFAIYD